MKAKPVLRHYGAKWTIAKWVVSHLPEHRIYVEPFCGSAAVLFTKPRSFIEVINDMDGEIVEMFRVLRKKPFELAALIWATPYSPSSCELELRRLERAASFIAKSAMVYVGDANTSTFSLDKSGASHKPKPAVWRDWAERVFPAAERLRGVQILNECALSVIERFRDNPDALIYLDPPYHKHENEFRFGVDYARMRDLCEGAKAKIMVSEYPSASHLWAGWRTEQTEYVGRGRTGQNGAQRASKKNTEILFMNWGRP